MSSVASTFDAAAIAYEQQLQLGVSLSGESASFFVRGRVDWLASAVERHADMAPAMLLDFGCGVGNAVPELLRQFPVAQLIGVDCSIASLALAHRRFATELEYRHRVDWRKSTQPLPAQSIDLVYSAGVFHHIAPEQRQTELEQIYTSLKPGGLFALFENNPWNPGTRLVMSRIPFDRDAICLAPPETRQRLQLAGFELIETRFLFYFPRFLAPLRRAELLLRRLPLGAQYVVLARKP